MSNPILRMASPSRHQHDQGKSRLPYNSPAPQVGDSEGYIRGGTGAREMLVPARSVPASGKPGAEDRKRAKQSLPVQHEPPPDLPKVPVEQVESIVPELPRLGMQALGDRARRSRRREHPERVESVEPRLAARLVPLTSTGT
jgi:hypothetical protein